MIQFTKFIKYLYSNLFRKVKTTENSYSEFITIGFNFYWNYQVLTYNRKYLNAKFRILRLFILVCSTPL